MLVALRFVLLQILILEGIFLLKYGRFHYLDKAKFYYHARGSYVESLHWHEVIMERRLITKESLDQYGRIAQILGPKLNKLITTTKDNVSTKDKIH